MSARDVGPARDEARAPGAHDEPDLLRDQFRQLLRHRLLIVLGTVLGVLGGGWLGVSGGDSYTSTAEVSLRQPSTDPFAAGGAPVDKGISIESERQTAAGSAVTRLAARKLGVRDDGTRLRSGLKVASPPNTLVLQFTYTAGAPKTAAERADAFARAYLDRRREQTESQVATMLKGYKQQREPLLSKRGQNRGVDDQISVLDSKIADLTALDTTPGIVVRQAQVPTAPSGPPPAMMLGLGCAVGVALGLLAAWVRLVFDPTARSDGDVVRALGAPVLGTLPRGRTGRRALLAQGRTAEEYRSMAFRLAYDQRLAGRRGLLVVAPRGNSDTAAAVAVNLAASFVEMGQEVLLVEADLRAPSLLGRLRGADGVRQGWARSPARGDGGWPSGLQVPVDAGESGAFDLVPGVRVRNAVRALTSAPASQLIAAADQPGTTVVLHAPPVLSYADAIALVDRVGGVLVVCNPRDVHRSDLERIRELIAAAGGTVLGAVLHRERGAGKRSGGAHTGGEPDPGPPGPAPGTNGAQGTGHGTGPGTGPGPGLGTRPETGHRPGQDAGYDRGYDTGYGKGYDTGYDTGPPDPGRTAGRGPAHGAGPGADDGAADSTPRRPGRSARQR